MTGIKTASENENTIDLDFQQPEVICKIQGKAGVITLNRPKALNALNLDMIQEICYHLTLWESDPQVEFILVECAPKARAFCAGGDVRSVYEARLADDWEYMDHIFREEYIMNYQISHYSKPYISLIEGICMGGGMGLSVHGSHRIVTNNTIMAMPEASLGFFTDVGASYFLNQTPGKIGLLMGLTGEKLSAADCLYAGLATHYIPQHKWEDIRQVLKHAVSFDQAEKYILSHHQSPGVSELEGLQPLIDELFTGDSVENIQKNLEAKKHPKAHSWLKKMDTQSPTSMKVIYALLTKNKSAPIKKCLTTEFRIGQRFINSYDFFEGIRSILIDKDNRPRWQPSHLNEIKAKDIKNYFTPLGDKEIVL